MKRIKEKVVICFAILMMLIAQIPSSQLVNAQDDGKLSVVVNEIDRDTQSIEVSVGNKSITRIDLSLDGVIESREIGGNLSFDVHINGKYLITGYNAAGEFVDDESVFIDNFEDIVIEKDENHVVRIVSRYPLTREVLVNSNDTVSMDNTGYGYYEGSYTIPQNGKYTFVVKSSNGDLGSTTRAFTDLPVIEDPDTGEREPEVDLPEEPQPITNEADFIHLLNNPTANFILLNDIELTSDILNEVTFSGTLNGNGYMISGFKGSLFNSLENANINNVVLQGGLAKTSYNSTINDSGFYIEESDDTQDIAVLLNSDSTIINNSFVLMNVEGYRVAGFILEGTGTINNSYVSGYLKGEEVFGFGKDSKVINSYINASLIGKERTLFTNLVDGVKDDSFYDVQINDLEDEYATPMYTKDLITAEFTNDEFTIIEGQYPQIKNIQFMNEKAQQVSTLSVLSVKTESNLSALEGIVGTEEKKEVEWVQSEEEISANTNTFMNRFALRQAVVAETIEAGIQTTAKTTQISFPVEMNKYYKVVKTGETPEQPTTHETAIDEGWKIMYWSGTYRQTGLEWNKNYTVYSTDLAKLSTVGTIAIKYGDNGGKLTLTGDYVAGGEMKATLSEANTNRGKVTWKFVPIIGTSSAISTIFATNTPEVTVDMDEATGIVTYKVPESDQTISNYYLKVTFEADKETTGYEGILSDATTKIIKEEITNVAIVNRTAESDSRVEDKYILEDELVANMLPSGNENEVTFMWFHTGDNGSMDNIDYAKPIAVGRNYQIKGGDIGKSLFVRAEVKEEGRFKESKNSSSTTVVEGIKNATPEKSNLSATEKDDITVTLKMDVTDGLYRYGYSTDNNSSNLTIHPVLSRNQTETTITGLVSNTAYYFFVQRVGENGYEDSDWSNESLEVKTDNAHVKGDVVITGEYVFGKELTAKIINFPVEQAGQFVWYRLDDDGKRIESALATGSATYTLAQEDVGKKLEVAYVGKGDYAGEITTISDTIKKAEKDAPTTNLEFIELDDTTITVKMPSNSNKYILGVSNTESGVPIEQLDTEGKVLVFSASDTYKITGLERDTEYHLYVRYAENDTHYKSDWIDSGSKLSRKTAKKTFDGNISFAYETVDKLMQGQTLTANLTTLDLSFNYKGEWKWVRIAPTTSDETEITNFTLTDDKKGTQYVVPKDEMIGVKYKVIFTATVGYTGIVDSSSSAVHDIAKEKYEKPVADNIEMETIDDSSFKVKMTSGEGKYRFWYKKLDQNPWDSIRSIFNKTFVDPNDGYKEVNIGEDTKTDVIANVEVVVSGLDRNTEYIVKVQKVEDEKGYASDFTYSTEKTSDTSVTTMKTEIAGNVTIEGTTRYKQKLTAAYHEASYASIGEGKDTDGTWQWYRDNTPINNENSEIYQLGTDDIGHSLTAKYTMPDSHSFTGKAEANTSLIQKALGVSPAITSISSKDINGKLTMTVEGTLGEGGTDSVYYRLQLASADEPTIVPTIDSPNQIGWHKVTNPTMNIDKDCDEMELMNNTSYTIYFIKTATETEESAPLLSQVHKLGAFQQDGTIVFEKQAESSKETFVVGKTIKATLSSKNMDGKWKWYKSIAPYDGSTNTVAPDSNAVNDWEEITSGFSQTSDNETSTLNLSEDFFAYFIRAEFVANDESGYSGSISSADSQYVRKVYDEKIRITSSTKDGNGNPKAYANTEITGTIENYAESGNLDRTTVQFKIGDKIITENVSIDNNTFTYIMENIEDDDTKEIVAEVSTPKIIGLYVDKDLKAMESKNVNSDTSTGTKIKYISGVPISNLTDLENFMKRATGYDDYSENAKFVLTEDIDMSESKYNYENGTHLHNFQGVFDGDYHIVNGLATYLFHYIRNKDANVLGKATVKNLIILNSNMNVGGSAGTLARQALTDFTVERVMSLNSSIRGSYYTGLLMGRAVHDRNNTLDYKMNISEVMSAGGSVTSTNGSGVNQDGAGALIGEAQIPIFMNDVSTVSTHVSSKVKVGGLIGIVDKSSRIQSPNILAMNNVLASSTLKNASSSFGPILGTKAKGDVIQNNVYYDSTIYNLDNNTGFGEGRPTVELIGNALFDTFGTEKWVYKEGYYPRLAWLKNNPMAVLYTATRGAFTSVDGKTSAENMFTGNISGSIQIPEEFQTKDFKVETSDTGILKITDGGTIIPVGDSGKSATITIIYTKPDSAVKVELENTFVFTVGTQINEMGNISIFDNETNSVLSSAPEMNQVLKANVDGANTYTYQWYRRQSGTTTKQKITGEIGQVYTVKPSDVGYEISVLVHAEGYASTYSSFTQEAVSISPKEPIVTDITDKSVKLNANENSVFKYEFGYERVDANALITQVEGTYTANEGVTVNNLQRNKMYNFYVRVAASEDNSYPASDWSLATQVSTLTTEIIGTPKLGTAINNGESLALNIETTNGQTGEWKLERVDPNNESNATPITFISSENYATYQLQTADVGYRIKATFSGTKDFIGEASSTTEVIQQSTLNAPNAPIYVSSKDTEITVKMESAGTYDIAYSTEASGEKIVTENVGNQQEVTFSNLNRNKDYYFFARSSKTDSSVASPWSKDRALKTEQTVVTGEVSKNGEVKVDSSVSYSLPENSIYTGTWKLERMKQDSESVTSTTTISPSNYTVLNNVLTYKVQPKDAEAKLKVTFTGNGDFKGTIFYETSEVSNGNQEIAQSMSNSTTISDIKDHSFKIRANEGLDVYQFGYAINGTRDITTVVATVRAKTDVLVDGLMRNTEYNIYVRIAAKTGYDASEWVKVTSSLKTEKSALTGTVQYFKIVNGEEKPAKVGVAELGVTYKAKYISGNYSVNSSDTSGHWQWYADDSPIDGGTNETYEIKPMDGVEEISVSFIADDTSDFSGLRSADIGTLTKPKYEPPTQLPTVEAVVEDGETGSKLKITSDDYLNVFYFVQNAKDTKVPATILASAAKDNGAKPNQWFIASPEVILNLEVNTEYVVYVARLEDGGHLSSGVVSLRTVRTVKDDISKIDNIIITEADNTQWKVLQDKELRISSSNQPVEGVWQYYVSKTNDVETSWQNVTSEIKTRATEGKEATYSFAKVNVPSKYNEYYVRVVFVGRGDFEKSEIYNSSNALIGTEIKGKAEISIGNTSEVFVPINVEYVCDKDEDGNEIKDEQNGVWTWYRKNSTSFIPEVIQTNKVGTSDRYTLKAEDVGKQIYAVYTASTGGTHSGSVISAVINNVVRAVQNKPNAIALKQVNGTSVEINLPSNMLTNGKTIAQPRLEYRIQNINTENKWIVNATGNAWINGLDANTMYEVRAIFEGTSEYEPSEPSDILEVKTGNQLFDINNLTITKPESLVVGSEINATYIGSGYNEGSFVLKRSNGDIISLTNEPTLTSGFLFFKSGSSSITYTLTEDDIGNNIIVQFVANTDAHTYGGSIEKSTEEVVKAKATTPLKPTLEQIEYFETKLKVIVDTANEYVLKESVSAVVGESEWKKLYPVDNEYYTFTNLSKEKEYYLHTRVAEATNKGASDKVVSDPLKPWARKEYKITYIDVNKEEHSNPTIYTELDTIALANAIRTGYTFIGWTSVETVEPTIGLSILIYSSGNKEFTAHWAINKYDVIFESNGGSTVEKSEVNHNGQVVKPEDPTKEGHTFDGWYSNSELTTPFNFTSTITSETTIYARWEINTYKVTFETNGGSAVAEQKVEHDGKVSKPENPTKEGHTFDGWFKEDTLVNEWNFEIDKVIANTSIYAKFIKILDIVKASKDTSTRLNKGDTVELFAEEGTTIYYTIDGNEPTNITTKYIGPITINDAVTIKAIAVKEGYATSEVATFMYEVIGDLTIEQPADSVGQVNNTNDEIIKAVLSEDEFNNYLGGMDAKVRINFKKITGDLSNLITNALDGRKVAERIDITLFKQVGIDSETEVRKLNESLYIVIKIPKELLSPPEGTKRTFDVMRIHDNIAEYLTDSDSDNETVTVKSDKFSEYILCYKDEIANLPENPEEPSNSDKSGVPEVSGDPEEPILPNSPAISENNDKDIATDKGGTTVNPGPAEKLPSVTPGESNKDSKSSLNNILLPVWMLMYIGGFIALFARRKEEK